MSSLPSPEAHILDVVWQTIYERREAFKAGANPSSSRTMRLFKKGRKKAAQKYGEEAVECLIEAVQGRTELLVEESADMLYHWLVMLAASGVDPDAVWQALAKRHGMSEAEERRARQAIETGGSTCDLTGASSKSTPSD
jgi:phosphoribosyl-ATP pyrophosphohydrolase